MLTGFDLCRAALAVTGITAPEQSVLTTLAIMADKAAQCWPGINGAAGITGKTKLSERTVQRALVGLRDAGHIEWIDNPGKGRIYTVHPRHSDTPVTETPRQSDTPVTLTPTPVTVTPKQPITTTSQKAAPSSRARKRAKPFRLPADWKPVRFADDTVARSVVDRRGGIGRWQPSKASVPGPPMPRTRTAKAGRPTGRQHGRNGSSSRTTTMGNEADHAISPWQETTGSVRQLAQRSASSVAAEVQRNLHNLTPAAVRDITIALAPCLALVGGTGMHEDARVEWLRAAAETLRGIPTDLLRRGCDAAKRTADHPSKIVPHIMREIGDTWDWRKAQRSAPLDNRHIEPEKRACTPEEAAAICKRYGVGSASAHRAANPSQPTTVATTADPDRACREPSREDYIRLFGIDPGAQQDAA